MLVRRLCRSKYRETKCMLISCCYIAVQNHNIKIANPKRKKKRKCGTVHSVQNCMCKELKYIINSRSASNHSAQNIDFPSVILKHKLKCTNL